MTGRQKPPLLPIAGDPVPDGRMELNSFVNLRGRRIGAGSMTGRFAQNRHDGVMPARPLSR